MTGRRVYYEIHTADSGLVTQDLVSRGRTVVSLLVASEKAYPIHFFRDKDAWPAYMSISNISKDLQRQGSKCECVLVALLAIPQMNPKDGKIHRSWP